MNQSNLSLPPYPMKFLKPVLSLFLCGGLLAASAFAHSQGEDYLFLNARKDSIDGYFEIFFKDLDEKLNLKLTGSEEMYESRIDASAPEVHRYIRENFSIGANGAKYEIEFTRQDVLDVPKGWLAQYHFEIDTLGLVPDVLEFEHNMLYENDSMHRGLLVLSYNDRTRESYGETNVVLIFSEKANAQQLDLTNPPSIIWGFKDMVPQGVWHIWIGLDHILFLLALLLPTVIVRGKAGIESVSSFSGALWQVGKIVTVFTLAHSVTLVLAALDLVSISSRIVESIIALSIVLVALNSIFGKFKDGSLVAILVLGLFHGLGFASVMGDLPFRMTSLIQCVIGFNVGVELGQLAIVVVLFPVLFLLGKQKLYFPVVQVGGSIVLIAISSIWFVERAFDL